MRSPRECAWIAIPPKEQADAIGAPRTAGVPPASSRPPSKAPSGHPGPHRSRSPASCQSKIMFQLDGKKALVTGAATGLGQAIAVALARNGAGVALSDLRAESLAETEAMIE